MMIKKYATISILILLVVVACSTGKTQSQQILVNDDDMLNELRQEIEYKAAFIDSLQSMIDYLNFQVDSLYTEIEIFSSKVLVNDSFVIPNSYSFAGVEFELTNDRIRSKLQDIFNREVRGASQYIPRSGVYFALFDSILTKNNIHTDVKYLAVAESYLNSVVVSQASAGGIWQFIPSTAKIYDLKIDNFMDERRNIFKATEAACRYLHQAHRELRASGVDDWLLTLAAYNSGVGNIRRSIREQGGNDFFSLIMRVEETNNYIWRAIAIKMIFEFEDIIFPNKFERMPPLLETAKLVPVTTKGYYDLSDWAIAQGTTASAIWELNPWIDISRSRTGRYSQINHLIIQPGTYEILVPRNAVPDLAKVAEIETKFLVENNSPFLTGSSVQHRVVRGETLGGIARRYGVTVADIKKWNNLRSDNIGIGQVLHLQGRQSTSTSTSSTSSSSNTSSSSQTRRYTVVRGDTLSQIAEKLGVSTAHLRTKNNIPANSHMIKVGQVLEY